MDKKNVSNQESYKTSLEDLKKKYNVSRIWSFSRVNCYINCSYSYYLKYIRNIKELDTNIYSILGGQFHDILEKFYKGIITYEDMITESEMCILTMVMDEKKFDKNNKERNQNIEDKYFTCMRHFFSNHIPVQKKVLCEQHIMIKVGNNYFQGYIDAIHKNENDYIITDYKSSTIYTGAKIEKEGRQLILYALGLNQKGIPLENIKIRWNFLKYNSITYIQKNGKEKTTNSERWSWVAKIKSPLRMNLKDSKQYSEFEIEQMLDKAIEDNNLNSFPDDIKQKYIVSDCYIYIPLSKEITSNLEEELNDKIIEIYKKEKLTEQAINEDEKNKIWEREVLEKDFFFCSNICGYRPIQCKCYKKFLDSQKFFNGNNKNQSINNYKDEEDNDESILETLGLL
jgi:RecB family exonuclease